MKNILQNKRQAITNHYAQLILLKYHMGGER